jgi:hypothetical protein
MVKTFVCVMVKMSVSACLECVMVNKLVPLSVLWLKSLFLYGCIVLVKELVSKWLECVMVKRFVLAWLKTCYSQKVSFSMAGMGFGQKVSFCMCCIPKVSFCTTGICHG